MTPIDFDAQIPQIQHVRKNELISFLEETDSSLFFILIITIYPVTHAWSTSVLTSFSTFPTAHLPYN